MEVPRIKTIATGVATFVVGRHYIRHWGPSLGGFVKECFIKNPEQTAELGATALQQEVELEVLPSQEQQ